MSADEKMSLRKMILNMDGTNIPFPGFIFILTRIMNKPAPIEKYSYLTFTFLNMFLASSLNLLYETLIWSYFHFEHDNGKFPL